MVLVVKHLPTKAGDKKETWVQRLGQEDPLEEAMTTHFSILAWRIPWTDEPDRVQSIGSQRVGHHWSNLACMQKLHLFLRWSSGDLRVSITYITRDITLPTKVLLVKAVVFPGDMYRCESWAIKKAKPQRIDAFELRCWTRLLSVPWTTRSSTQSIERKSVLNVHWKDWCWSWNSNILATWCKELTHLKRPWFWEKDGGQEEKGMTEDEMVRGHHRLNGHEFG